MNVEHPRLAVRMLQLERPDRVLRLSDCMFRRLSGYESQLERQNRELKPSIEAEHLSSPKEVVPA